MNEITPQEWNLLQLDLDSLLSFCHFRIFYGVKSNFYIAYFYNDPFIFQSWIRILNCLTLDEGRYIYVAEVIGLMPVLDLLFKAQFPDKRYGSKPTILFITRKFYVDLPHTYFHKRPCLIKISETSVGLAAYLESIVDISE